MFDPLAAAEGDGEGGGLGQCDGNAAFSVLPSWWNVWGTAGIWWRSIFLDSR
ncbi:hypothetical protein QUB00_26625 [Microcoleus sp. F8_C2]